MTGEYRETVSQLAEKLVAEALLLAEDVKVVVDNCMDRWAAAQSGASSQPVYSDLHCSSSMSTTHTVWALLSHALRQVSGILRSSSQETVSLLLILRLQLQSFRFRWDDQVIKVVIYLTATSFWTYF